jgi:hypothetical protein
MPLTGFTEHRRIDVASDGADQVACGTLDLVKGLGGGLPTPCATMTGFRRIRAIVTASSTRSME